MFGLMAFSSRATTDQFKWWSTPSHGNYEWWRRQRIKHAKHIDGSQKHFSYLKSPEYADLQVVLNQLKKTNTNVVFMITPVNTKWEEKTGLDMQMYYQTAKKIKFQLQAQGFNHIIDYSHAGSKPVIFFKRASFSKSSG